MNIDMYLEYNDPEDDLFDEEIDHLRNSNKAVAELKDLKEQLRV